MALNTRLSQNSRNIQLDALAALVDDGYLRIYNGTQPNTPDDPVSGQTLLAELRFGSPAFEPAADGAIVARAITPDNDAPANGTASWFRVLASDGSTVLWDGSIGTSGCNINFNSVAIQQNEKVSVDAYAHSLPMQGS